jgi:branched-subunit amino acid aminotransferase/4-amino-4-deoxychorismate lyase
MASPQPGDCILDNTPDGAEAGAVLVVTQAKEATSYDLTAFHIDWEARTVTCLQGQVATDWELHLDRWGGESNHVCFPRPACAAQFKYSSRGFLALANLIYGTPVQKVPQFVRGVIAAIE